MELIDHADLGPPSYTQLGRDQLVLHWKEKVYQFPLPIKAVGKPMFVQHEGSLVALVCVRDGVWQCFPRHDMQHLKHEVERFINQSSVRTP